MDVAIPGGGVANRGYGGGPAGGVSRRGAAPANGGGDCRGIGRGVLHAQVSQ